MKGFLGFVVFVAIIGIVIWSYVGDGIEERWDIPISTTDLTGRADSVHNTEAEIQREADPTLRHLPLKQRMLTLTNQERQAAGVPPVRLGTNPAAQLHAEASLEGCYSAHWDQWGLKPNHRYTLTGGTGADAENGHGSDYCIRAHENYTPITSMDDEIADAVQGWMESPGHRKTLLDPAHTVLDVGIAHDRYNTVMLQHFSSDYVAYRVHPHMDTTGTLRLEASTEGATLKIGKTSSIQIYYDPPPRKLTRGQLSYTYSLCNGLRIGHIVKPLPAGTFYTDPAVKQDTQSFKCVDPYHTDPLRTSPASNEAAHQDWARAKAASARIRRVGTETIRITADHMRLSENQISVQARLNDLLEALGPGIYTVILWGRPLHMSETTPVSEQAIFWQTQPPAGNPYAVYWEPRRIHQARGSSEHEAPTPEPTLDPEEPTQGNSPPQPTATAVTPTLVPEAVPTILPPLPQVLPTPLPAELRPIPTPAAPLVSTPGLSSVTATIPSATMEPTPTVLPTILPTPETGPQTYNSSAFGYSIEHPQNWSVTTEGDRTVIRGPSASGGYIVIDRFPVTRDQSIGDLADMYMRELLAQAPSWDHFNAKWGAAGSRNTSGPYIKLEFSWKKPASSCTEAGETHIFRSKYAPRELAGYALTMASCQGGQEPPAEDFQGYLESFEE